MNTEIKQPIEDAAKLLGYDTSEFKWDYHIAYIRRLNSNWILFDPLDPERGDLMKVADAAELEIRFNLLSVVFYGPAGLQVMIPFEKGDYQSLAEAVLRAASAVLKSRGE